MFSFFLSFPSYLTMGIILIKAKQRSCTCTSSGSEVKQRSADWMDRKARICSYHNSLAIALHNGRCSHWTSHVCAVHGQWIMNKVAHLLHPIQWPHPLHRTCMVGVRSNEPNKRSSTWRKELVSGTLTHHLTMTNRQCKWPHWQHFSKLDSIHFSE